MLLGVELRRAVAHLAEQPLRAAAERARVVDVHVVVLAAHRLLDQRLLDAHAVDLQIVLLLVDDVVGAARGVEDGEVGHRHPRLLQRAVELAAVEEEPLLREVVERERLPQRDVRLRLLQREARREEGDQRLAQRPLLDRLVEQRVVAEVDDAELAPPVRRVRREQVQHLVHRLRPRLLVHRAHADDDRPAVAQRAPRRLRARGRWRRRVRRRWCGCAAVPQPPPRRRREPEREEEGRDRKAARRAYRAHDDRRKLASDTCVQTGHRRSTCGNCVSWPRKTQAASTARSTAAELAPSEVL